MDTATSENVYAGNAMSHRAVYMYGGLLPRGVLGQVDDGLGKAMGGGTPTLMACRCSSRWCRALRRRRR
jgi:alkyl sulfatase BDS1-like metallo-beta-lactamase superfamily hydrolase